MKIIQISDLHFGAHNSALAENLKDKIKSHKPDLIIASGDIVDDPQDDLLKEAQDYLLELVKLSDGQQQVANGTPRLIVVPGNHDFFVSGIFPMPWWKSRLRKYFAQFPTEHFFLNEKVWVYGFDSASDGSFSGGKITDEDLTKFNKSFEGYKNSHGKNFADAFKIAVVHHHPLPVNWDTDSRQRWLTMYNAGTLLATVLHRKVDMVLHGHEHLQGRARLKSALGGNGGGNEDDWETVVISLGATLKDVKNPDKNWFNVITIDDGHVHLESFDANQAAFFDIGTPYTIRSREQAQKLKFSSWADGVGFRYREMSSLTLLNKDGDALRRVVCENLKMDRDGLARAVQHDVQIPQTSGFLGKVHAKGLSNITGMIVQATPNANQQAVASIKYDPIPAGQYVSYEYSWYCVNAFAMDERQFALMRGEGAKTEFTHFYVQDPCEILTVVVQFPDGFRPNMPTIRVSRIDTTKDSREWVRVIEIEADLKQNNALCYVDQIGAAILQVYRPVKGLSYGIQWDIPPYNGKSGAGGSEEEGQIEEGQITRIIQCMLDLRTTGDKPFFQNLLSIMATAVRDVFFVIDKKTGQKWNGPFEVSIMMFDQNSKEMVVLCSANIGAGDQLSASLSLSDYSNVRFKWGEGLAGRAFKGGASRFYVQPKQEDTSPEPAYYRVLNNGAKHAVLLSIPINGPKSGTTYAVLNIGSDRSDCPLRAVNAAYDLVTSFQLVISEALFKEFKQKCLT